MNFKGILLIGLIACVAQLACAQDSNTAVSEFQVAPPPAPPEFLLVLRTDDKTVIVDPETNDMPAIESVVDARWVQSVEMITGEEALSRYGLKGRNGVIIIQFKPNYVFPLGLPEAIKDGE
ncbi:hypothetical protein WBG78_23975 [Chryseolinea sp. T2]|uniref:hypothetical protein n=1 Tax=Chryseolinea sp. T2 TaxID=3129255 RepID=UPI0030769F7B